MRARQNNDTNTNHPSPNDTITIIDHPSPNVSKRVNCLVLHYTALDLKESLAILTDPKKKVSAHYVVPKEPMDGKREVFRLVPEDECAWHAGVSGWQGTSGLNKTSIGVEIVNLGCKDAGQSGQEEWDPFPPYQIDTVIELCTEIIKRYPDITPTRVVGHADIAPNRKVDPGPLFPWKELYEKGIGAWYEDKDKQATESFIGQREVDIKWVQKNLSTYGYPIKATGELDQQTKEVVSAFQMHFRPSDYSGKIDRETCAVLNALIKKYYPKEGLVLAEEHLLSKENLSKGNNNGVECFIASAVIGAVCCPRAIFAAVSQVVFPAASIAAWLKVFMNIRNAWCAYKQRSLYEDLYFFQKTWIMTKAMTKAIVNFDTLVAGVITAAAVLSFTAAAQLVPALFVLTLAARTLYHVGASVVNLVLAGIKCLDPRVVYFEEEMQTKDGAARLEQYKQDCRQEVREDLKAAVQHFMQAIACATLSAALLLACHAVPGLNIIFTAAVHFFHLPTVGVAIISGIMSGLHTVATTLSLPLLAGLTYGAGISILLWGRSIFSSLLLVLFGSGPDVPGSSSLPAGGLGSKEKRHEVFSMFSWNGIKNDIRGIKKDIKNVLSKLPVCVPIGHDAHPASKMGLR